MAKFGHWQELPQEVWPPALNVELKRLQTVKFMVPLPDYRFKTFCFGVPSLSLSTS